MLEWHRSVGKTAYLATQKVLPGIVCVDGVGYTEMF